LLPHRFINTYSTLFYWLLLAIARHDLARKLGLKISFFVWLAQNDVSLRQDYIALGQEHIALSQEYIALDQDHVALA